MTQCILFASAYTAKQLKTMYFVLYLLSVETVQVESEEIYILANFMERKNVILFGTAKGAGFQARKNKAWQELERIMKAAGYNRSWDVCRRKWIDVSHRAKTYDHNYIDKVLR